MSKQLDAGIVHKFVKANRKLIPHKKQIAQQGSNSHFCGHKLVELICKLNEHIVKILRRSMYDLI